MVICIDSARYDNRTIVKPLTCFEIIGLPGSGKTSLARELGNRHTQFHLKSPPDWKQLKYFPFYFKNSLSLAPVWASLAFGRQGRRPTVQEFLLTIFLNGWYRNLIRPGPDGGIIILDQGPVFMLSEMLLSRERQMIDSYFSRWWKKVLINWRCILTKVVWLDSCDSVLAQRINMREKGHAIKGASSSRTRDFLGRHREALDKALTMLKGCRRTPDVTFFDSGRQSLDEITDQLLKEFGLDGERS